MKYLLLVMSFLTLNLSGQIKKKKQVKKQITTKVVRVKEGETLDHDGLYRKAYDLNSKEKRKEALLCIDEAIKLADTIAEYYVLKCYITGNLGDNETCLATAEKGLKYAPENDELWHLKGTSHHFLNQPQASFDSYEKALQYDKFRALYYNNYLDALKYQKKYDKMIAIYQLFLEVKKDEVINDLSDYEHDIHFYAALAYQMKGDLKTAVDVLSQSITLEPNYAPYYNNRALLYSDLKQHTYALADYNKGISLDPNNGQLYYNRAITYLELEDYSKAEKDILKNIKIKGESADALVNLGNAYLGLKNYPNAEKAYLKAKTLDPGNKIVDNNLAELYLATGKKEKSEQAVKQALEKADEPYKVNYNRGYDLARNNQYKEAIPFLEKAIEINPNFASSYNELGLCYAHFEEYNKAVTLYSKGIKLNPNEKAFYINRGNAFKNLQKYTEAENDYKQFNTLFPSESGIGYYSLATLYLKSNPTKAGLYFKLADDVHFEEPNFYIDYLSFLSNNDIKKGLVFANKAIHKFPNEFSVLVNVASIYEENEMLKEAETLLLKINKQFPQNVSSFYNLGNLYLIHKKDYNKAMENYKQAIKNNPEFPEPYLNLATAYQYLGKHNLVVPTYEELLKKFPNNYDVYYNLGDYYTRTGKHDKAVQAFEKSFDLMDAESANTNSTTSGTIKGKSEKALLKAQAYLQLKNNEKAKIAFEEYLLFNQKDASAYGNYAYCLFELNQPEKALLSFDKAFQLKSTEIDFLVGLIATNYLMNNKTKLVKYKTILKTQFKNYPLNNQLLQILEEEGYFYSATFKNIWNEAIK